MNKYNTIGVDLAKNVIQVCVISATNKQLANKELTRKKFAEFLIKQKPALRLITGHALPVAMAMRRRLSQHWLLHLLGRAIKQTRMMRWLSPKQLDGQT
jgi:transposase